MAAYYSLKFLLRLLIALKTVTLIAQPVKGDASEGQSNPEGCISDWRGLKKAYLDHKSSADVENSIFGFYPSHVINYGVLVMFYDVGPPPNTSTSGRRECCQRGSKDCIIHFIYRYKMFRYIYPVLLYSRAGHRFRISLNKINQLCWAPPPLCNHSWSASILPEFSVQFISQLLEESPFDVKMSAYVYTPSRTSHRIVLRLITVIPILLFVTVGLFLALYIHNNWELLAKVLAHSQVTRHATRSTMLASWILLPLMIVHFHTVTREMADTVQKKAPFTLFQDVYMPQVTAGYVQWRSFLAILLLEAPFLCVFFLRKSTDLHNRRQQLLCRWIRVLYDTLGGIGAVAAVQFASVYLFYNILHFMVSPMFVIAFVFNTVAWILVGIMCITMILQMVSSCCRTCSCEQIIQGLGYLQLGLLCIVIDFYSLEHVLKGDIFTIVSVAYISTYILVTAVCIAMLLQMVTYSFEQVIKGLAFLLLGLLCIAINVYAVKQLKAYEQNYQDSVDGLLTSLVSSVIGVIYGYVVKKLLRDLEEENTP